MTDAVASAASTASTASATQTNLTAGATSLNTSYSTFLTLLTTQLQNQDPTSPLDTNQFTQQLVAMTGVQQQLLSNQLLQTIANSSTAGGGVAGAVGLIGKQATATTSNATLSGGNAAWSYSLPSNAAAATLTISDSTGKTVWSGAASGLNAGANAFSWNGKDSSGVQQPDGGTYSLSVAAADATGAQLASTVSISGTVSAVATSGGATTVKIGATSVPLSSVTGVTS
jgi:flagellar basal-body rod modification protein FlgD